MFVDELELNSDSDGAQSDAPRGTALCTCSKPASGVGGRMPDEEALPSWPGKRKRRMLARKMPML
jgi:hypothetical protein